VIQAVLVCLASLNAAEPPLRAELQPGVPAARIDGLEDTVVTIPDKARFQLSRIDTASGRRIRITINDVTFDVTKARIWNNGSIVKLWIDVDGRMCMEKIDIPQAPVPRPK
jgi:hypothetical protein